jgi:hypothetical protein
MTATILICLECSSTIGLAQSADWTDVAFLNCKILLWNKISFINSRKRYFTLCGLLLQREMCGDGGCGRVLAVVVVLCVAAVLAVSCAPTMRNQQQQASLRLLRKVKGKPDLLSCAKSKVSQIFSPTQSQK